MLNFRNYNFVKKQIKGKTYKLYIANTPAQRKQGLSGEVSPVKNEGMLFIFDSNVTSSFTMKKCNLKLKIIFYDANWNFIDVFTGIPRSNQSISPHKPYKYVVEILA